MKLLDSILTQAASIASLRRDIHAHPELCFEEVRTADVVAQKLTEWGIPVHRGMGTTGVVGTVHGRDGGACGRAIGLRADMDALPMQEHNHFAHKSQHAGKMHACGHDGHTAMLLAAGQHLAQHRDFDGTVYLIFQPAEEGGGGAREMIKDGLFEQFPVEAVFGMHNWPGLPVGTFAASTGPVMASSNDFCIVIRGKGSHAALPHNGIDPVPVACQMVMAFQTIITRNKKPVDAGVISVTMVHTGEANNVVPDSCEIRGTVRTFTFEVLDLIERRMREIAEHTCAAFGATCEFRFNRNYPPTVNHPAETAFARAVMADIVGAECVLDQEPTMGAEDFAYMLQARPGCYVFIANGDGAHRAGYEGGGHDVGPCMLHNPHYDFNDDLIPLGATYWVRLAEQWLAQPRAGVSA
ncbi:MAG TPA: amidohydrolase [Hydrogenophaga sp.]|jgi:hippurate hydrolase|uniref:M20 aminoacylase family protein n=1 Tax=Hydrogenophaga sp. TaxID=1904254 RepID=UPI0008C792E9|nr:M20 aminoacylase family protein [Hydrogenophaga sp.]MBU4182051.1 amidohydrolase [Gammaproteobacteria bacterium]MBW8468346.1 amidohydrolase [Thiobacillus sp.]OGA75285.1 MAG: amidohydrolase [Burkholderiales bacterium GWE1_65_30]OGA93417.1 MAG: amidohydrolase [Burkholderiales bacterium GWF1_66_17]PKO76119.1 MAG: amidohydrolase [Betaproteobacteria bacterium HGW-Betaproteobacteria-15]